MHHRLLTLRTAGTARAARASVGMTARASIGISACPAARRIVRAAARRMVRPTARRIVRATALRIRATARRIRPTIRATARTTVTALALVALATAIAPASSTAQATGEPYDVLIRDGRVLDGSGNPWFRADVAIRGDRIVAVGRLGDAAAREVIDARGLYVAPGFIDAHSHAAGGLESESRSHARPLLAQGVTTVIVNPDGGGAVDLGRQREALLRHGLGVNVAQLVPHGSVRAEVLGMADRAPTAAELDRMRALVRAGMDEGAFGLSSGPFYAPGSFASTHELVELARVAAAFDGAYTSHIRDESNYTIGVIAAVDEVIEVAREAGLPGVVTHVKALGPPVWGYSMAIVRRIERAREEGAEVFADQYPYEASSTGLAAALLPRWAQAGGGDSLRARLADPAQLERIRAEMVENLARRGGADRIQLHSFSPDRSIEGRLLSEVAEARGLHPIDAALALFRQGSPSIVSFNMHEDDIRTLMVQPWMMTASDGSLPEWGVGVPHPRAYGTFPRKLRRYALDEGVLGLEAAVRSMTSLPAAVFRIPDRGVLRPGSVADVVVFDALALRDRATYAEPHQLSEGVVHLLVGGETAIRDGEFTGAMPGQVLRRSADARSASP